jgi:1-acyl-sn-glycerol-3-phosphate acyltransferase|tara:strand:+ start:285 stop:887 length:603 start_codon:yes stop_codon:yes gene_type:complete
MVYPISRRTIIPLLGLFIAKVNGIGNVPTKGPFIVVARETSYIDPFLIGITLIKKINRKVHTLVNPRFWHLLGDTICKKWGACIPVEKENKNKSIGEALSVLKKGDPVMIFPPGSLRKKEPKTGVSRLHLLSKIRLLPVNVRNSRKILPLGKTIPKLRKEAVITIGKPFTLERYYKQKITNNLLKKIANEIMSKVDSLSA